MFFRGEDEYDQLVKITKVLGSDDLFRWGRGGIEGSAAMCSLQQCCRSVLFACACASPH